MARMSEACWTSSWQGYLAHSMLCCLHESIILMATTWQVVQPDIWSLGAFVFRVSNPAGPNAALLLDWLTSRIGLPIYDMAILVFVTHAASPANRNFNLCHSVSLLSVFSPSYSLLKVVVRACDSSSSSLDPSPSFN